MSALVATVRTVVAAIGLVVCSVIVACSSGDGPRSVDSAAVPAEELPDLAAQFADAVWRVETDGCGRLGIGSAFAIGTRHLVTNSHVVAIDSSPIVRSRSGKVLAGRVIGAVERPDVAVIEVGEDLTTVVAWAATEDLRRAEPIVIMGYPTPDRVFAMTTGEIVTFQPPAGREALLSNAPVDRGNSGGPALRRDGTVAGVVTRMITDDASGRVIAVAFTASATQDTVEGFIREPDPNVTSRCGIGPDYIPPVPDDFVPPPPQAFPPEPSQPARTLPADAPATQPATQPPVPATARPTAPTSALACPRANVSIAITAVTSTAVVGEPGWWEVRVAGVIRNDSVADVVIERLDVRIDGDPPRDAVGFPDVTPLASGRSTAWEAGDYVHSPDQEPSAATARLHWRWAASDYGSCGSNDVSHQGP